MIKNRYTSEDGCRIFSDIPSIIERLFEYENTGFTPEEIKENITKPILNNSKKKIIIDAEYKDVERTDVNE